MTEAAQFVFAVDGKRGRGGVVKDQVHREVEQVGGLKENIFSTVSL